MFQPWYSTHTAATLALLADLHQHPETGFEERRTADIVRKHFAQAGSGG
jgi:metal-dependent amidase/aminoacylase/carboxypeptidase family protein